MIISFAKTTGALLAGRKTETRRDWSDKHAALVMKQIDEGKTFDAWNYSPRVVSQNPHKIATLKLQPLRSEWSHQIPDLWGNAHEAEGFGWMMENGLGEEVDTIIEAWITKPRLVWVVRFAVVE